MKEKFTKQTNKLSKLNFNLKNNIYSFLYFTDLINRISFINKRIQSDLEKNKCYKKVKFFIENLYSNPLEEDKLLNLLNEKFSVFELSKTHKQNIFLYIITKFFEEDYVSLYKFIAANFSPKDFFEFQKFKTNVSELFISGLSLIKDIEYAKLLSDFLKKNEKITLKEITVLIETCDDAEKTKSSFKKKFGPDNLRLDSFQHILCINDFYSFIENTAELKIIKLSIATDDEVSENMDLFARRTLSILEQKKIMKIQFCFEECSGTNLNLYSATDILKKNQFLKILKIRNLEVNEDGCFEFCKALKTNSSIEEISLKLDFYNFKDLKTLTKNILRKIIYNKNIKRFRLHLDRDSCQYGNEESEDYMKKCYVFFFNIFARFIRKNNSLQYLIIKIEDQEIFEFKQEYLNLLVKAFRQNKSLNYFRINNHLSERNRVCDSK